MRAPTSGGQAGGSGDGRLSVGEEVRVALEAAAVREHQRRRLIHILALAQILLTLAAIPGYVSPEPKVALLSVLGAALAINIAAFLASRLFNNVTAGAYLLVFGGGLVVVAQLLVQGLTGDAPATAQATIFFLVTILEASLLFSAEITFIIALFTTLVTGGAIVFALAQGKVIPNSEVYLLVVSSMSIQVLTGVVAWLVAHFLFESASAAQRAQGLRLNAAQLDAIRQRSDQQQQRLDEGIHALQGAIGRVLGGEPGSARVEPVPGELHDLMRSFNILIERVQSLADNSQGGVSSAESIRQMIDLVSAIAEGSPYAPAGVNPRADTPLGAVMQALLHLQTRTARKSVKLQELAADVAGAVQTGLDGFANTTEDISQASQLTGVLIGIVDVLLPEVKQSLVMATQARELVGQLLPADVLQAAMEDAVHRDASGLSPEQAALLLGRGSDLGGLTDIFEAGLTGEYEALPADAAVDTSIPPLTVPLPALTRDPAAPAAAPTTGSGDPQERTLELWRMLVALSGRLAREDGTLRRLSRELGILARSVRNSDAGIGHGAASLEAARLAVRQLQQIAGTNAASSFSDDYLPVAPAPVSAPPVVPPIGAGASSPANVGAGSGFDHSAPNLSPQDSMGGDEGYLDASALLDASIFDEPARSSSKKPRPPLDGERSKSGKK